MGEEESKEEEEEEDDDDGGEDDEDEEEVGGMEGNGKEDAYSNVQWYHQEVRQQRRVRRVARLERSRRASNWILFFAVTAFILFLLKCGLNLVWWLSLEYDNNLSCNINSADCIWGHFLQKWSVIFTNVLPDLIPSLTLA